MFLKEKVGNDFTLLWPQLLHYRAKTGVFSSNEIWEDAEMVDGITWWKCHGNGAVPLKKWTVGTTSATTHHVGKKSQQTKMNLLK
jgi:hypothetical protein